MADPTATEIRMIEIMFYYLTVRCMHRTLAIGVVIRAMKFERLDCQSYTNVILWFDLI